MTVAAPKKKNVLVATKGKLLPNGLYEIWLDAYQGTNHIGRMLVRSGLRGAQNFREWPKQKTGIYEPCPEGRYKLSDLMWAGGKGNYKALWPLINSPIWVELDVKDFEGRSRAIGLHFDAGTPGSAGCIVFPDEATMKRFVDWWNGYGGFEEIYVDWGKGYSPAPANLKPVKAA